MKKETIELYRDKNHIHNYGITCWSKDYKFQEENYVLNSIVEWSKDKNITIYKHLVRIEEENVSDTRFYEKFLDQVGQLKIPFCDRVVYLDIFYQEKD